MARPRWRRPLQPYSYYAPDAPPTPVVHRAETTTMVVDRDRQLWPWLALLGLVLLLVVGYLLLRDDEEVTPVVNPAPARSTVVVSPAPAQPAPPVIVQQPPAPGPTLTVRETRTQQIPAPAPPAQQPPAQQPPAQQPPAQQAPATTAPSAAPS